MALKTTDPWYVPLPDSRSDPENRRYRRALALSEMRRFVETMRDRPRYADAVAYRQHCLDNWQDYLDGKIDPPTGRKPAP